MWYSTESSAFGEINAHSDRTMRKTVYDQSRWKVENKIQRCTSTAQDLMRMVGLWADHDR